MREPPGPLWGRAASCCLLPRQISGRREACPPARRPRRELRSARRLEARPGPAGLATASNRSGCLCVAWPGPAAAHRRRGQAQVLWLAYGSARQAARSSETAIAFACTCMRGIETAIAFAGAKWAFSVQFSGAKVSMVSMVAVRGASIGVVGFKALRRSALHASFSRKCRWWGCVGVRQRGGIPEDPAPYHERSVSSVPHSGVTVGGRPV